MKYGIVSSKTLERTGSFSARTNLAAQSRFDKQYARDLLRAVSKGQKACNPGVTDVKKATKKQSSKSRVRKGAKKAPAARKATKAPRAKKSSTTKARTPVAASSLDPVQKINVVDAIAKMMLDPKGASMAEMVAATGYEAHPMRAKIKLVRDRLGYAVTPPSKENGRRYFAVAPKADK